MVAGLLTGSCASTPVDPSQDPFYDSSADLPAADRFREHVDPDELFDPLLRNYEPDGSYADWIPLTRDFVFEVDDELQELLDQGLLLADDPNDRSHLWSDGSRITLRLSGVATAEGEIVVPLLWTWITPFSNAAALGCRYDRWTESVVSLEDGHVIRETDYDTDLMVQVVGAGDGPVNVALGLILDDDDPDRMTVEVLDDHGAVTARLEDVDARDRSRSIRPFGQHLLVRYLTDDGEELMALHDLRGRPTSPLIRDAAWGLLVPGRPELAHRAWVFGGLEVSSEQQILADWDGIPGPGEEVRSRLRRTLSAEDPLQGDSPELLVDELGVVVGELPGHGLSDHRLQIPIDADGLPVHLPEGVTGLVRLGTFYRRGLFDSADSDVAHDGWLVVLDTAGGRRFTCGRGRAEHVLEQLPLLPRYDRFERTIYQLLRGNSTPLERFAVRDADGGGWSILGEDLEQTVYRFPADQPIADAGEAFEAFHDMDRATWQAWLDQVDREFAEAASRQAELRRQVHAEYEQALADRDQRRARDLHDCFGQAELLEFYETFGPEDMLSEGVYDLRRHDVDEATIEQLFGKDAVWEYDNARYQAAQSPWNQQSATEAFTARFQSSWANTRSSDERIAETRARTQALQDWTYGRSSWRPSDR